MIIELHILQNFAPSCLNRDDTNTPKDCLFGGHRRARISSQCLKREIRHAGKDQKDETSQSFFEQYTKVPISSRTKLIVSELQKRLVASGKSEEDATKVAIEFACVYSSKKGKMDAKKPEETQVMLYMSRHELDEIARQLLAFDWVKLLPAIEASKPKSKKAETEDKAEDDEKATGKSPLKKMTDDWAKATANRTSAPDIALFGRMLADKPESNIDAACQVAHAISTHKVGVESDFYTAVDDLQPAGETGAGMMGDIQFNSACFYRYANIDLNQLKKNLVGKEWNQASDSEKKDASELSLKTVEAFIRASIAAIPSGKKNSFAPQNPPDFVCAIVRNSGEWSLANAFSRPVNEGNLVSNSIDALVNYWGRLNTAYPPKEGSIKATPAFSLTDNALTGLDQVNSIENLVMAVNRAIAKDC
jgi:CRISPR system Cascade subunit CasC